MWYKILKIYKFVIGILLLVFIGFYIWTVSMYTGLTNNSLMKSNILTIIGIGILLIIGYFPILSYITNKAIEEGFPKKEVSYKWQIIFKIDLGITTISTAICTLDLIVGVFICIITRDCPNIFFMYVLLISFVIAIFTSIPLYWLERKALNEKDKNTIVK